MNKLLPSALFLSLSLSAASISQTSATGPFGITDNNTTTVDIAVAGSRTIIGGFSVTLTGLNHTWTGDLRATITHVDTATTVNLFTRPGRLLSASFGAGCSTDLGGNYTFSDSGSLAFVPCPGGAYASGNYRAAEDQGATDEVQILIANVFNGQSANGTWRLAIADLNTGDSGSISSWTLNLEVQDAGVPEPATFGFAALGVTGLIAFRRRRT